MELKTGRVKGFVCGILVAGIILSGFNIYANEKKQKENENIIKAMESLESGINLNVTGKNKNVNTSTAYSNIAIYEELKEMNSKLDKLLK